MKNTHALWIVIAILVAVIIGLGAFVMTNNATMSYPPSPNGNNPVACTMEAKKCPDGTYVGRQGPNCEFAACPSSTKVEIQY